MFDCHLHTGFSTDSKMKVEEAIEKAQALNMGIIITEHMDLNYPRVGEFRFDPKAYFEAYGKYRNSKVLLGIELGMCEEYLEKNRHIAKEHPFDYVLGSLHFVNGMDIFDKALYKDRNKKEVYEEYFTALLKNLKKYDFIDSVAHIDYISRYGTYDDKEMYYEEFGEYIDEVLKEIARNERALEINSRRFADKKAVSNMKKVYKRFYELGGKFVTLGSDSHHESGIGSHFSLISKIVEETKLQMVYFKERKMEIISRRD